jgi:hypothetical protein
MVPMRRLVAITTAVGFAVAAHSGAAFGSGGGQLVANPGAESGELAPWAGDSWGVERYGASSVPSTEYAQRSSELAALGSYLFVATATGATLEQAVSLGELNSSIESGSQELYFHAWLGGQSSSGSPTATVTFDDAQTHTIGSPIALGPIAASDLSEQLTLLSCEMSVRVPISSRSAIVKLTGASTSGIAPDYGLADNVYLSTVQPAIPDSAGPYELYPSGTPNCSKLEIDPAFAGAPPLSGSDPPPASAVPGDTPALALRRVRAARGGRAYVSVACSGAPGSRCRGDLVITTSVRRDHRASLRLGSLPITVSTGQAVTVAIHLNRAGRRLLDARRTLRVTLTALAGDGEVDGRNAASRAIVMDA